MKLVKKDLANGRIEVIPLDSEDLYTLYNIIAPGDLIRSKTSRRIKRGKEITESSSRVLVTVLLKTESVEFQGFGEIIRVRGKILEASDSQITLGSYHTIKIELLRKLSIIKDGWSSTELEFIYDSQLGSPSGLLIVGIDDQSAIVSQVGTHATRILLELNPSIPRKGSDIKQHVKATQEFFSELADFLTEKKEEGISDYLIIGGPGFTKEAFISYLNENNKKIAKTMLSIATNSAGRTGVREILFEHLPDDYVAGITASTQAFLIKRVLEEIGKDTGLIAYGSDVIYAAEIGAVDHLLVLDSEFRESIAKREKIQGLIETVKENRGKSTLMSSMHENTGDILKGLGGIVALLRFKLPKK